MFNSPLIKLKISEESIIKNTLDHYESERKKMKCKTTKEQKEEFIRVIQKLISSSEILKGGKSFNKWFDLASKMEFEQSEILRFNGQYLESQASKYIGLELLHSLGVLKFNNL